MIDRHPGAKRKRSLDVEGVHNCPSFCISNLAAPQSTSGHCGGCCINKPMLITVFYTYSTRRSLEALLQGWVSKPGGPPSGISTGLLPILNVTLSPSRLLSESLCQRQNTLIISSVSYISSLRYTHVNIDIETTERFKKQIIFQRKMADVKSKKSKNY